MPIFNKKTFVDEEKFDREIKHLKYMADSGWEKIRRLERIILNLAEHGDASFWLCGGNGVMETDFTEAPDVEPVEGNHVRKVTIRLPKKGAQ